MDIDSRPFAVAPCTVGSYTYRIKRYRERAEELRTIADDLTTDDCRATLIRLANTYEQLAVQAATLEQS